jgi:hypothetical protein
LALRQAALAQLVEQLICNQQVIGSTPVRGSERSETLSRAVHQPRKTRSIFTSVIFDDETEMIAP